MPDHFEHSDLNRSLAKPTPAPARVTHEDVPAQSLVLRSCTLPRPGDQLFWYHEHRLCSGILIGHDPVGKPKVRETTGNGSEYLLEDYEQIRPPHEHVPPCWARCRKARIAKPTPAEKEQFDRLLEQRIPPGPKYIDLITEIGERGFEIFVVGGTVRDVISSSEAHDVDLVTTIPLARVLPLVRSMYGQPRKLAPGAGRNGHFHLGGKLGTADPYIDLCVMKLSCPGSSQAVFAADLDADISYRDFACNSVYYDPINNVLIDPDGRGIEDANMKRLRLVCNLNGINPIKRAQIAIRFIKFLSRGFIADDDLRDKMRSEATNFLPAMSASRRVSYVAAQIVSKCTGEERSDKLKSFESEFVSMGLADIWKGLMEPLKEEFMRV